ncbi:MAG: PrgI family protein [Candidatus Komeilibacteria bacterium]|jgi:hypothetical protein|nr:PrgI family protein [Candidatus Komeilibacteria bacterium]MBT4447972.1 PrgI family protein [Candidatus Komeilibacteria bacterium]
MPERFIVPQFIDSEDKIWGPITVRQFIIILSGFFFAFVAYKTSDFALFIFLAVVIAALVGVFAFYKVNGAPFHIFAVNFIETTFKKPSLRVWHKQEIRVKEFKLKNEKSEKDVLVAPKKMAPSKKLSELSLIIDTGGVYKGEQLANTENNVSFSNKNI